MFIAALFIIARTWKQLRCPLADEWIRKLWYIYTVEYYSAIKKKFESVLMRWMKLEPIIQSERKVKWLSHVQLFATPWTAAYQAPPGFARQEYWSGVPLPYNPAIPLLGIYTKETRIERDTCTPLFIAALFIIARTRKQLDVHQQMNG